MVGSVALCLSLSCPYIRVGCPNGWRVVAPLPVLAVNRVIDLAATQVCPMVAALLSVVRTGLRAWARNSPPKATKRAEVSGAVNGGATKVYILLWPNTSPTVYEYSSPGVKGPRVAEWIMPGQRVHVHALQLHSALCQHWHAHWCCVPLLTRITPASGVGRGATQVIAVERSGGWAECDGDMETNRARLPYAV